MANEFNMNMQNFQNLMTRFSPDRACMVRGRPGIGKSQGIYQVASKIKHPDYQNFEFCVQATNALTAESSVVKALKRFWKKNASNSVYADYLPTREMPFGVWHFDMGLPVVERRLSQMTEGDIVGLPFDSEHGTVFKQCAWLTLACRFPCALFLDELNRAIKGVEQATFQLADSKAFYGMSLNEGTRMYIACNIGDQFDVTPMDPAAVSRYAIIDLEPSLDDWMTWAKEECHPCLVEFIRAHEKLLEYVGVFEPNTKYPDRRAWGNLDAELTYADLYANPDSQLFLHMAAAMVGFQAGNQFWTFAKNRQNDISAKDILSDWPKTKKRMEGFCKSAEKRAAKYVELSQLVSDVVSKKILSKPEILNLVAFIKDAPAEPGTATFLSASSQNDNMLAIHPLLKDFLVKLLPEMQKAGEKKAEDEKKAAEAPAAVEEPETKTPAPKKRK